MIVAARKYVREAMICQCDEWCARNSGKMSAILPTLYRRHHQPATERPASLDCQPSCQAMGCILNSMEYQCRLVAFLTDDFDEVCSHACLEVYNPDTGDWELHDPLYDIHFIDKRTKKVLAAAAVAFGDFERVVPTNRAHVGWENVGQYGDAAFLRDHYYEMVAYNHASSNCLVVIDGDRASLARKFPKNSNKSLQEFLDGVYHHPAIFEVRKPKPSQGETSAQREKRAAEARPPSLILSDHMAGNRATE